MAKMNACAHFLVQGKCDPWIMDHFKKAGPSQAGPPWKRTCLERAEGICSTCEFYMKKEGKDLFSATQRLFMKGKLIKSADN